MGTARRRILVLAGHDPTGGAGVDADREAALAHGVDAHCVVTAETDQDGRQVFAIRPRDPEEWLAEARAWLRSEGLGDRTVIKTGLLPGADHVHAVAQLAREFAGLCWVVDPVLASSGGTRFLDERGQAALLEELLPLGPILTPNLPEAALLTARLPKELADPKQRIAAGRELLDRGARAVLLKGGHGFEDPVRDLVLARGASPAWHDHARIPGASLHGSGCRYASTVAAELAQGSSLEAATDAAGRFLVALLAKKERK